jgi:sugar lactone lactonase YvrE
VAEFRTLLSGLGMGESARWREDRLVFADWGAGEIVAVDLDGTRETVTTVEADGMPFCLDWLPDGRMVVITQDGLKVLGADGVLAAYANLAGLSEYAWNEIAVDPRGNIYLNNINFDFGGEFAPGIVVLVRPDGSVHQVADGIAFPNGMAVTADGRTLIVAESYGGVLTAFDIAEDGGLDNRRVWADLGGAAPDGICLDAEGAVWFAEVPGQRCVRVTEGGEVRQTISADLGCFSCALGGPDQRTLLAAAAAWPDVMTPGSRTGLVLRAEV